MHYEIFYDTVKDHNGVLRLTIPSKVVKFIGLEEGNLVKIMIQKQIKKEDE